MIFSGVSRRALAPAARSRPHRTARRRVPILDLILNIIAKEKRRRSARTSRSCLVRRSASWILSKKQQQYGFPFFPPLASRRGLTFLSHSHWFSSQQMTCLCTESKSVLCCVVPRSPRVSENKGRTTRSVNSLHLKSLARFSKSSHLSAVHGLL